MDKSLPLDIIHPEIISFSLISRFCYKNTFLSNKREKQSWSRTGKMIINIKSAERKSGEKIVCN